MHFIYFDESKHDNKHYVYSALVLDVLVWRETLDALISMRRQMKEEYGIYTSKELHAHKFVSGKGQISNRPIHKEERAEIFKRVLKYYAKLAKRRSAQQITLINSINTNEEYAFDNIINRINRTMKTFDSHALLIFDAGQEAAFTKRIRKMRLFNPIPSNFGGWEQGKTTKNLTIDRILEDPVFKDSKQSYFIQMVDFIAYALLRREVPLETKNRYGMHECFDLLEPLCYKKATRYDPMGIIR